MNRIIRTQAWYRHGFYLEIQIIFGTVYSILHRYEVRFRLFLGTVNSYDVCSKSNMNMQIKQKQLPVSVCSFVTVQVTWRSLSTPDEMNRLKLGYRDDPWWWQKMVDHFKKNIFNRPIKDDTRLCVSQHIKERNRFFFLNCYYLLFRFLLNHCCLYNNNKNCFCR